MHPAKPVRSKTENNRVDAFVTPASTFCLYLDLAERQIQIIVNNNHIPRNRMVFAHQFSYTFAACVHIRQRLGQKNGIVPFSGVRDRCVAFDGIQRNTQHLGKTINNAPPQIVAGCFVFFPRIAQTYDQKSHF